MAHQHVLFRGALLTRLAGAAIISMVAMSAMSAPALASPWDPIPPKPKPWGWSFGTGESGESGSSNTGEGVSSSGKPPVERPCVWYHANLTGPCDWDDPGDGGGPPTVTPAQLAAIAMERLRLPLPAVRTAPPRGSNGLVGLPHWFWVTNWRPATARATAGSVWAVVHARPLRTTISPGGGLPAIGCRGHGTPYDPSRPATSQNPTCAVTYVQSSARQPGNTYAASVTVIWGGTWVGSDGSGGPLPEIARTTSVPLRIAEGQSVTGG